MKKTWIMAVLAAAFLYACKNKKNDATKVAGPSAETNSPASTTTAPDPRADSAAIRSVITGFYNWYDTAYQALDDYPLYRSAKKNGGPPYRIDWTVAENYQRYLRAAAPQLGESFLAAQKRFLQSCDSAFKVDTEDELPYGFDYDWYTNSQEEPAYLIEQLNKPGAWDIRIRGEEAVVAIKGSYNDGSREVVQTILKVDMKKEGGSWKIANIGGE